MTPLARSMVLGHSQMDQAALAIVPKLIDAQFFEVTGIFGYSDNGVES